jgi:hypothetical protein
VLGAGKVLKGIYGAYQALNAIKGLTVIATAAEAKATDIANSSSVRYTEAMLAEIMTTRELARMKGVLTAANAGVAASSVAAAGASGAAGAAGGAASSAAAGAAAGGLIASAKTMALAFVAQLKALGGVIAGFLTAPVLGLAAAGTAAILSPFIYKLMQERKAAEDSLKKVEAMQQALAEKRIKAEADARAKSEIGDLRSGFQDVELRNRLEMAPDNFAQAAILQQERARLQEQVTAAQMRADQFIATGKDGKSRWAGDPVGGARAVEELRKATERYNGVLDMESSKLKEINQEQRRSVMEQIKGIEDVMRARQQERKEIEASFMSAKERFGMMNAADQASALAALERARTMQAGSIDEDTMSKLQQVGTDESQRLIRANALARADAAGFTQRAGGDTASRIAAIDAEQATDVGELSRLSGQRDTDLASRARGPQVEIVDRTQIDVQMKIQEDQLFNRIFGMVTDANLQLMQRLEARINAEASKQAEEETAIMKESFQRNGAG